MAFAACLRILLLLCSSLLPGELFALAVHGEGHTMPPTSTMLFGLVSFPPPLSLLSLCVRTYGRAYVRACVCSCTRACVRECGTAPTAAEAIPRLPRCHQ